MVDPDGREGRLPRLNLARRCAIERTEIPEVM
jgi:hypothetical protein